MDRAAAQRYVDRAEGAVTQCNVGADSQTSPDSKQRKLDIAMHGTLPTLTVSQCAHLHVSRGRGELISDIPSLWLLYCIVLDDLSGMQALYHLPTVLPSKPCCQSHQAKGAGDRSVRDGPDNR